MKTFVIAEKALEIIFFYFYLCFITDSHVKFSLDEMTIDVLRIVTVAPTQLHSNSWAALEAFRLACKMLNLNARIRPTSKVTWLSLVGQSKRCVLALYITSYKHFKNSTLELKSRKGEENIFMIEKPRDFTFIGLITQQK